MAIQSNFPSLKPTLLLDFANTKQLDPRITFTRASTATYYDGKTTAMAEQNLLTYSQEFDNAAWVKTNATVTANATTAPDGTTTADTINGSAGSAYILEALTVTSGVTYTFSVYAKANTTNFLQIAGGSSGFGTNVWANFDLSGGTVGTTGSLTTASIQSIGSGWYRCVITGAATATISPGNIFALIPVESSSATRFPTNAGTTSIYVWGAQLEQRSSVTAYTATTTAPITNYIPVLLTAASGVARFDNNPTTGESLGLLLEEQRTNLLTYSDQFDNAAWTKTASTITANAVVAPDGTLTADKAIASATTGSHEIVRSPGVSTSTAYSASVYLKAGEYTTATFRITNAGAGYLTYNVNLLDGTGTFTGSGTGSITPVGNGWYRVVINITATASSGGYVSYEVFPKDTTSYTGDGYSGIYIWGAQLEAGAFATSYIATTSAQVTRAADAATMTGTNFSSWYRADEGTLYGDFVCNGLLAVSNGIGFVSDGTTNNRIGMYAATSSTVGGFVSANGTTQANMTGTLSANAIGKTAITYKVNDFAFSLNGGAALTDTSGQIPSVNSFSIGAIIASPSSNTLNGTIKKFAYYPARVTNAQLQALTS